MLGLSVMLPQRLWALFLNLLRCPFEGLEHLEGEAHHAAVLAPALEVEGLLVVVEEHLREEPLVVVEALGPLRDGIVLDLACLLTHLAYSLPLLLLLRPRVQ